MSCRMVALSRRDLCSRSLLCQMNYFLLCILLPQSVPEAPRVSQEAPRISQGAPWSPLGSPGLPPFKLQAQCSPFAMPVHKIKPSGTRHRTPREPRGATGDGEVVSRTAARSPPPTRAGGQDDGSYTNSLKLCMLCSYIAILV